MTNRIVIAENHTIIREGLRALLSSNPEYEIVGEAADGRQAIRRVDKLNPDLVLMDLSMPRMNGIVAIREIKKRFPQTKILALTVHKTEEYVLAALEAGSNGYISKDATNEELELAIRSILAGKTYLCPDISGSVIKGYLEGQKSNRDTSLLNILTAREQEVLQLIAEGYKNKEIAEMLFISVKTVDTHRTNLMRKLDLHNASALTAFAIENGLIVK
ncbi:MAG: response regulator transcription factor [Desulfobacterales bacterium]|nr:response regulator transcription factor [Desulfobacterales bacterium]